MNYESIFVGQQVREHSDPANAKRVTLVDGSGNPLAGMGVDPVGLKNKSGVSVNPATDDRGIDMMSFLLMIKNVISNPSYLDKSANAIRNQVQSGTITTVTTVTTVAGLTNIDGYQGKLPIKNNNMAAWALACRARIT